MIVHIRGVDGKMQTLEGVSSISLYPRTDSDRQPEMIVYFEEPMVKALYYPLADVGNVTTVAESR